MAVGKIGKLITEGGTSGNAAPPQPDVSRQDVSREDLKKRVRPNARKS